MTDQPVKSPQEILVATLKTIRSLTVDQYQERVKEAELSVRTSIGKKPEVEDYKVKMFSKFTGVQWMMFSLLIVLFLFSLVHVLSWARVESLKSWDTINPPTTQSTDDKSVGIVLDKSVYILLQQISVLFVTEIGMVALSIYHMYRASEHGVKPFPTGFWLTLFYKVPIWFISRYFFMILAGLIGLSVLNANLSSGFNSFVSALVPIITISLSEMFAQIFAQNYQERLEQERQFKAALSIWTGYHTNPNTYPQYNQYLSGRIQDWYRRNTSYKDIEWEPKLLQYLAAREKALHSRTLNDDYLVQQLADEFNRPFLSAPAAQQLPSPIPPLE